MCQTPTSHNISIKSDRSINARYGYVDSVCHLPVTSLSPGLSDVWSAGFSVVGLVVKGMLVWRSGVVYSAGGAPDVGPVGVLLGYSPVSVN